MKDFIEKDDSISDNENNEYVNAELKQVFNACTNTQKTMVNSQVEYEQADIALTQMTDATLINEDISPKNKPIRGCHTKILKYKFLDGHPLYDTHYVSVRPETE